MASLHASSLHAIDSTASGYGELHEHSRSARVHASTWMAMQSESGIRSPRVWVAEGFCGGVPVGDISYWQ